MILDASKIADVVIILNSDEWCKKNSWNGQLFSKYETTYIHNETLSYAGATLNDSFGQAIAISEQNIYVGAPER